MGSGGSSRSYELEEEKKRRASHGGTDQQPKYRSANRRFSTGTIAPKQVIEEKQKEISKKISSKSTHSDPLDKLSALQDESVLCKGPPTLETKQSSSAQPAPLSPTKQCQETGTKSFLIAVGGTIQGQTGYYAESADSVTWQYWTVDSSGTWELVTDELEPFATDNSGDAEGDTVAEDLLNTFERDAAVVEQTTTVLFELFQEYAKLEDDPGNSNRLEIMKVVEETLATGNVDVDAQDSWGKTLLMYACESRMLHGVQQLVRLGADVDKPNFAGVTPLHVCCYETTHSVPILKYLLEHKAYPNVADSEQCTPMHYAACTGLAVLVALLLLHNAHTKKTDCRGFTPLDFAVQFGHARIVELLGAVGAVGQEWFEYVDPKTGYPYYYNTVTGESRWHRPGTDKLTGNSAAHEIIAQLLLEYKASAEGKAQETTSARRGSISSVSEGYTGQAPANIFPESKEEEEDEVADLPQFSHPGSPSLRRAISRGHLTPPGKPGEVESKEAWENWVQESMRTLDVSKRKELFQSKKELLSFEQSQYDLLKTQLEVVEETEGTSKEELEALRQELKDKDEELSNLREQVQEEQRQELEDAQRVAREDAERIAKENMAELMKELERKKELLGTVQGELTKVKMISVPKAEEAEEQRKKLEEEAERMRARALEEAQSVAEKKVQNIVEKMQQEQIAAQKLQDQLEQLATDKEQESEKRKALEEQKQLILTQQQEMQALMAQVKAENDALRKTVLKEQEERRKYYNQLEDIKGRIRLYCRVRPPLGSETEKPLSTVINEDLHNHVTVTRSRSTVSGQKKKIVKNYEFDVVFGPECTQEQVFLDTKLLVQSACDGYTVCIFAYGQTGSGKTHTMLGSAPQHGGSIGPESGIVPRAVERVFQVAKKESDSKRFTIQFYQVELYCDKLVDLLADPAAPEVPLAIKMDKATERVNIEGATVVTVESVEELNEWIRKGSLRRTTASTLMNVESSRSHLISTIVIKSENKTSGDEYIGKLTLVDLAGSERLKKTGAANDEETLKQAQSINQSLSALGNVIGALVNGSKHIPYRNNNLTMLMSDSIGGNAKTLMIVNVSPTEDSVTETENSLQYAQRIKTVKQSGTGAQVKTKEIEALKAQIARLKAAK